MDVEALESAILAVFREVTPQLLPNEVKGVEVTTTPKEDGTSVCTIEEQRGPVEVTSEATRALRPLARAIAIAVVEHIESHAEITGTGAGTDWRIT
jgi:hypothetical protein